MHEGAAEPAPHEESMPAYYTHLYFAMLLKDKLPYASNAVIRSFRK